MVNSHILNDAENGAVRPAGSSGPDSTLQSLDSPALAQDLPFIEERQSALEKPGQQRNLKHRLLHGGLLWLSQHLPMKNQVLFYTIRDDGKLEGNAAALYPYIKGKKVIAARRLPHPKKYEYQMMLEIMRSRVIVTDDYCRYLRNFPLRKDQKVIQLWHACGAFKKFGRFGTNLREEVDLATHAQYSLVSVSGEAVRDVYADAFGISRDKVRALGDPRTDLFFDGKKQEKIRDSVYRRYPQLKGKRVVLYAPTFRGKTDRERGTFTPKADFKKLSESLPSDMVFLIRPHPIMKKTVLDENLPNILEVRDFSTNDLMFVSDLMVTDYSSVIFEYSLLRKPVLFFCYDFDTYERGFYLRYPEDLPGDVLRTQEELAARLNSAEWDKMGEGYDEFVKRYMSACDGHSSERIAGLINRYMAQGR